MMIVCILWGSLCAEAAVEKAMEGRVRAHWCAISAAVLAGLAGETTTPMRRRAK